MAPSDPGPQRALVLFDGECNLCNRSLHFIIRRDPRAYFQFAPLQSDIARDLLEEHHVVIDASSTMVLIENGTAFTRSTAALRIARRLRFPWMLVYFLFIWIPPVMRDAAYGLVAAWRYRLFGRARSCPILPPESAARFLQSAP